MSADAAGEFPHFGPQILADGRVHFALWAPSVSEVCLERDNTPPLSMHADGEGWFSLSLPCAYGSRYRFGIGGGRAVPDPASRYQPQGVEGSSELIDPARYVWKHLEWGGRPWNEIVIYELHVGVFGGYRGVMAQLPRLAALGITAIELMPLAEFPGTRNWGYDGVLLFAPESAYGHPDELKALIDAAHDLNLMVYLDVVYNHFGPQGNGLGDYAEPFFRRDIATPWGAAVDLRVPQVRQFYTQNALYWLEEFRFDGLRLDAVHALHDPAFVAELGRGIRQRLGTQRRVHLMLENEDNDAGLLEESFDAQWNDDAHNSLHVLLTGETEGYYAHHAEQPIEKLARCLSDGFSFQGDAFPGYGGRPRGSPSAHLSPGRFIFFLQNHDHIGNRALGERLTTLCDPQVLRVAITLQLLCPQVPLLFMGEEWGSVTPFLFFTDYRDETAEHVREGRRREFANFAAFADPERRRLIPDPNAPETFTRSVPHPGDADQAGHAAVLALYRRLLALRREHLVPRLKGTRARRVSVPSSQALIANWRLGDGSRLRIAANFGDRPVSIPRTSSALIFESSGGCADSIAKGRLPARCACVFLSGPAP